MLDCFVDFDKSSAAISLADQNIIIKGHPSKRHNMYGWKICCQWKDGSMTWESLKDLKESHPQEMAECAITQGIDHEPAFNWWVTQILRLHKHIFSFVKKLKLSYLKKNTKFRIEVPMPFDVPMTVDHAVKINERNGKIPETANIKRKSLHTFGANRRYQRTKIGKVIKIAQS